MAYFNTNNWQHRRLVADRFGRIAAECAIPYDGPRKTNYKCSSRCEEHTIAIIPLPAEIVYCSRFFALPLYSDGCMDDTQTSTTLHEITHIVDVMGIKMDDDAIMGDNMQKWWDLDPEETMESSYNYDYFAQGE